MWSYIIDINVNVTSIMDSLLNIHNICQLAESLLKNFLLAVSSYTINSGLMSLDEKLMLRKWQGDSFII